MGSETALVPVERVERMILFIRGEKVMLDSDLAELYGVETKRLNEAVKRHAGRFPADFMFQLSDAETTALRSQFATSNEATPIGQSALKSQLATSNTERGGRRYAPYAFTEQGVAMLSSVLNSERAVAVNIEIMRAFVRLRRWLMENKELAAKLDALERKYDVQFKAVFDAIRQLMQPTPLPANAAPSRRIGFRGEKARGKK